MRCWLVLLILVTGCAAPDHRAKSEDDCVIVPRPIPTDPQLTMIIGASGESFQVFELIPEYVADLRVVTPSEDVPLTQGAMYRMELTQSGDRATVIIKDDSCMPILEDTLSGTAYEYGEQPLAPSVRSGRSRDYVAFYFEDYFYTVTFVVSD